MNGVAIEITLVALIVGTLHVFVQNVKNSHGNKFSRGTHVRKDVWSPYKGASSSSSRPAPPAPTTPPRRGRFQKKPVDLTSDDCESIQGCVIDRDRENTESFRQSMLHLSSLSVDWSNKCCNTSYQHSSVVLRFSTRTMQRRLF